MPSSSSASSSGRWPRKPTGTVSTASSAATSIMPRSRKRPVSATSTAETGSKVARLSPSTRMAGSRSSPGPPWRTPRRRSRPAGGCARHDPHPRRHGCLAPAGQWRGANVERSCSRSGTARCKTEFFVAGWLSDRSVADVPRDSPRISASARDCCASGRRTSRRHSRHHGGPHRNQVRRHCLKAGLPFTTSLHTRFPEYLSARLPVPERWTWAWLRRFHNAGSGVMAATPALAEELTRRGFREVMLWPRGVDAELFRPRPGSDLGVPRPVFLTVGRVAVEKNLDAYLSLDLPGSKVVVGDGPARADLVRRFPDAVFLGTKTNEALAAVYAAADVFVFPSKTDTFGLVLLEALASGVPVAAFPVAGPRDVIGGSAVGALDCDLQAACLRALTLSSGACRAFALNMSWEASARKFLTNAMKSVPACDAVAGLGLSAHNVSQQPRPGGESIESR